MPNGDAPAIRKIFRLSAHLEVTIAGAPRLNVTFSEVGLSGGQSQNLSVGGGVWIQDIGDSPGRGCGKT